ncbi:PH domain-containing protein [Methanobrevibacter sp. OttesenSCG-928-I08]|nr:PH domain-containing protein [Methanobrevibacter sp. OttesenSCG-928-I08]
MLFNKDDNIAGEEVIYKAKPNFFLSCKKAFIAFIILALLLGSTSVIIQFIGNLQVYLVNHINLTLTSYAVIAIVVFVLILILYIILQLISWYSTEYILTNQKITTKKGLFFTKKNYLPYSKIQDLSSSQSILGRILSVGSISIYSAYDNNQVIIKNVSNPNHIEEIIFNQMNANQYNRNPQNLSNQNEYSQYEDEYPPYENGEYYPHDNYNREEYYPNDNFQEKVNPNYNDENYYHEPVYPDTKYQQNKKQEPRNLFEDTQNFNEPGRNLFEDEDTLQNNRDLFEDEFDHTMNEAMHNINKDIEFQPKQNNDYSNNEHSYPKNESPYSRSKAMNQQDYTNDRYSYESQNIGYNSPKDYNQNDNPNFNQKPKKQPYYSNNQKNPQNFEEDVPYESTKDFSKKSKENILDRHSKKFKK